MRVAAIGFVVGLSLTGNRGEGAPFAAADAAAQDLGGVAAGKELARRAGGSSVTMVEGGRFVPWVVLANDGGKVWAPVVGSLDGDPVLLLDETVAGVRARGWVNQPGLLQGISFDLTEGPEGRSTQGTLRGYLTRVAGQRDGQAVAVVESTHGITVQDVFVRPREGGGWRKWLHFWSRADSRFAGADVWRGHALALIQDDAGYRFEVSAPAATATPPIPKPAAQGSPSCRTAIRGARFVTTAAGAIAVLGPSCDQPQSLAVEVWATGDGGGVVHWLPSSDSLELNALEARSISEIFVGGCSGGATPRPFIARLRGEKWEISPTPPGRGCVQRLRAGSRGDLWALVGELERGRLAHARLWRRPPSGRAWRSVDVPSPWSIPSQIIDIVTFDSDGSDDVWLTVAPQTASNKKATVPDAYAVMRLSPER